MNFVLQEKDGTRFYGGAGRDKFDLDYPRYVSLPNATIYRLTIKEGVLETDPDLPRPDWCEDFEPFPVNVVLRVD